MIVVGGSSGGGPAGGLAKELGAVLGAVTTRRFPDGEAYVRLGEEVEGEGVAVVQTTHPDAALVELLLLLDAARRAGADPVVACVPYLAYARQDRLFEPGEALSAQVVARAISSGSDAVVTVDPHEPALPSRFQVPAVATSAVPELAGHVGEVDVVLAPDEGALPLAEEAAALLDAAPDHLEKTRVSGREVEMAPKALEVEGRRVLLLDDIISTGGTMRAAVGELRERGAAHVTAACTHGLFVDDAVTKLREAGCDEVVATDSLPNPVARVSVAAALARGCRDILGSG